MILGKCRYCKSLFLGKKRYHDNKLVCKSCYEILPSLDLWLNSNLERYLLKKNE